MVGGGAAEGPPAPRSPYAVSAEQVTMARSPRVMAATASSQHWMTSPLPALGFGFLTLGLGLALAHLTLACVAACSTRGGARGRQHAGWQVSRVD